MSARELLDLVWLVPLLPLVGNAAGAFPFLPFVIDQSRIAPIASPNTAEPIASPFLTCCLRFLTGMSALAVRYCSHRSNYFIASSSDGALSAPTSDTACRMTTRALELSERGS